MATPILPTTEIPNKLKGFVYIVGMLGFPVVAAAYILVVLSGDMKGIQRELTNLSARISDRPMGLEKSTDFIVYSTQALEHELLSGLPQLIERMNLSAESRSHENISRTVTVIKRELSAYIRPIVRKHQRFASRFPTVGGNLGSFFVLSAPGEDIERGETEASLRSSSSQKFSEALLAMILNNLVEFGDNSLFVNAGRGVDEELAELLDSELAQLLGTANDVLAKSTEEQPIEETNKTGQYDIIDRAQYLHLTSNSVRIETTILRDQMLDKLKVNSTEAEPLNE